MELILDNTYGVSRIWSQEKDFLRGSRAKVGAVAARQRDLPAS